MNITFDQSWTNVRFAPINSSSSLLWCAKYETMLYYRSIRLIVEIFIFVLAYRAKSVKEFGSFTFDESCLSNRFVFFWRSMPDLVATIPYLSNVRIVWRLQRLEIFSCREICMLRSGLPNLLVFLLFSWLKILLVSGAGFWDFLLISEFSFSYEF